MNLQYDVLKGTQEQSMWLGSVRGLGRAIELMNRMAEIQPGDYFILSSLGKQIVAAIHTEPGTSRALEPGTAPAFDIFKGRYPNQEAVWLETVRGLANARQRMEQIATENPESYFVFSSHDNLVMAIFDTTRRSDFGPRKAKGKGAA
jgi:ligand-binding sensor domain-containing protein